MAKLYEGARKKIHKLLLKIYPEGHITDAYLERLYQLIENNLYHVSCSLNKWDETDTVLITCGNSIVEEQDPSTPLQTLHAFLKDHLKKVIRNVHILPFTPYSSDNGFSVIDYYQVNPTLGSWQDLQQISKDFGLMADLVINHVSTQSQWFQNYLQGKSPGKDYFIELDPDTDLSQVTHPINTPLLTRFQTSRGEKYVWTTFSPHQADLDFSNPEVFLEMLGVLFFYINQGIRIIRLDAIAYLWKEVGTSCIHLPQTHHIVRLIRELAELVHPDTIILTQTNVPDRENLSYFGTKGEEAHMIYQFPLPPLLLHTLHRGSSKYLTKWTRQVPDPGDEATYFNFTASQDGIALLPAEGLIPQEKMDQMMEKMKDFGGYVSTKTNADGSESPYEINITYFDALKGTHQGRDELQIGRFICSQTIMMSLRGIPGFYIHSLTATENDQEGVKHTGKPRSINRKKWTWQELKGKLNDQEDPAHQVFTELKRLMSIRNSQKAFHPNTPQETLDLGESLFALKRTPASGETIWSISNITGHKQEFNPEHLDGKGTLHDLISGKTFEDKANITLKPYQTAWLITTQRTDQRLAQR